MDKFEEVKSKIIEIMENDNRYGWTTKEIKDKLKHKNSSWTSQCLNLLKMEGKIIDASINQNRLWKVE